MSYGRHAKDIRCGVKQILGAKLVATIRGGRSEVDLLVSPILPTGINC